MARSLLLLRSLGMYMLCQQSLMFGMNMQGLSTWGHKVMHNVGIDLVAILFSKGFAIELGSSLSVVLGSVVGIPVSSTHCQIGSIVAVGIAETGFASVEWSVFGKIVVSWLVTVPLAAFVAGLLLLLCHATFQV